MERLSVPAKAALSALQHAERPLSAYDVLAAIRAVQPTAAAPTAYRALNKLIAVGKAHRLESLNAYIACCSDHQGEGATAFSICDDCGVVSEFSEPAVAKPLTQAARHEGFEPRKAVIELHGTCADCRGDIR